MNATQSHRSHPRPASGSIRGGYGLDGTHRGRDAEDDRRMHVVTSSSRWEPPKRSRQSPQHPPSVTPSHRERENNGRQCGAAAGGEHHRHGGGGGGGKANRRRHHSARVGHEQRSRYDRRNRENKHQHRQLIQQQQKEQRHRQQEKQEKEQPQHQPVNMHQYREPKKIIVAPAESTHGQRQSAEPSSLDSAPKLDPANDVHAKRIHQRRRQVMFGKNTAGYEEYVRRVPRDKRRPRSSDCPTTPDHTLDIPSKRWQGLMNAWRRALHKFDPPDLHLRQPSQSGSTITLAPRPCPTDADRAQEEIERAKAAGLQVAFGTMAVGGEAGMFSVDVAADDGAAGGGGTAQVARWPRRWAGSRRRQRRLHRSMRRRRIGR